MIVRAVLHRSVQGPTHLVLSDATPHGKDWWAVAVTLTDEQEAVVKEFFQKIGDPLG